MTTFLLIRHGLTDAVGHRITGRLPGVFLNETGKVQAAALPARLSRWKIDALYASPMERTMQTAVAVADRLGIPINEDWRFAEFDFGHWSGELISDLNQREDWQLFCRFRSGTRAPGGELIGEVQARMASGLADAAAKHPRQTVAVFSHADAIKAALLHYLPMPTDNINRLDIQPASISVVHLEPWGPTIGAINLTA